MVFFKRVLFLPKIIFEWLNFVYFIALVHIIVIKWTCQQYEKLFNINISLHNGQTEYCSSIINYVLATAVDIELYSFIYICLILFDSAI